MLSIFVRGDRLYWYTMFWLRLAIWGARTICGVRARVSGMENLPDARWFWPQAPVDLGDVCLPLPDAAAAVLRVQARALVVPFFGWAMGRLDMIHIDRSKRAEAWNKVAEQGRRFMATGHWVIMFPEGTRIARGQAGRTRPAPRGWPSPPSVPVVPIAVTSARCWPRKSFVLRPGVIDVSIGKPIASSGPRSLTR